MFRKYLERHRHVNSFLNGVKDMHFIESLSRTDDMSRLTGRVATTGIYTIDFFHFLSTLDMKYLIPFGIVTATNLWSYKDRLLLFLEKHGEKKREMVYREIGEY